MKKILAMLVAIALMLPAFSGLAVADTTSIAEKTVRALGIMTGDENGSMNLNQTVTRAEFTAMLISASNYKDSISTSSSTSVFKDVKYTHWAAQQIRMAVNAGWVTGYVDGTFRPSESVTLEEAAAMVLKLLGYNRSNLYGAYPTAYLEKLSSLGLAEGLSAKQGMALTRADAMMLFYNLMGAKTSDGQVYGTTLGYTVDASGNIDYTSVIAEDLKGPYVLEGQTLNQIVPFSPYTATIYRDSMEAEYGDVSKYDVIYYNASNQTIWAYSTKAFGLITSVAPNPVTPSSVTVGGVTYALGTASAVEKLSSSGSFSTGDTVTVLLGMNGEAVDVLEAATIDLASYGVVVDEGTTTYQDASGGSYMVDEVSVVTTDGVRRTFTNTSNTQFYTGDVVSITYLNGKTSLKRVSSKSMAGTFDYTNKEFGSYTLASDVAIIDIDGSGNYKSIYPERIDGKRLTSSDVYYYGFDENRRVSYLILKDATGDLNHYGLVTSVKENETEIDMGNGTTDTVVTSYTYKYLQDGVSGMATTTKAYDTKTTGGVYFDMDGNAVDDITALTSISVTGVSELSVLSGSLKYTVADDVQVYYKDGGTYTLTTLSAIADLDRYTVTAYRDAGFTAGGLVRVVLARDAE